MLVIGFGHRARQGKSLCAEAICAHATSKGFDARIYSFSDEVLWHCQERGLIPEATINWRSSIERKDLTPRQLEILGRVGFEERIHDPDFWIKRLFARIERDCYQVALIPNLRYRNEAERVTAAGGITVLIERFNADGSHYIAPERNPNLRSETSLRGWPWDFRLAAISGQTLWLERQARALFDYLGG